MKKTMCAVVVLTMSLFMVNLAFAQSSPSGWQSSFNQTFQQEGLNQAIADALAKGVTAADLTTQTLKMDM